MDSDGPGNRSHSGERIPKATNPSEARSSSSKKLPSIHLKRSSQTLVQGEQGGSCCGTLTGDSAKGSISNAGAKQESRRYSNYGGRCPMSKLPKLFVHEGDRRGSRRSVTADKGGPGTFFAKKDTETSLTIPESSPDGTVDRFEHGPSYERMVELNQTLKQMKVNTFKPKKHHSISVNPCCLAESDDHRLHPFRLIQGRHSLTLAPQKSKQAVKSLVAADLPGDKVISEPKWMKGAMKTHQYRQSLMSKTISVEKPPSGHGINVTPTKQVSEKTSQTLGSTSSISVSESYVKKRSSQTVPSKQTLKEEPGQSPARQSFPSQLHTTEQVPSLPDQQKYVVSEVLASASNINNLPSRKEHLQKVSQPAARRQTLRFRKSLAAKSVSDDYALKGDAYKRRSRVSRVSGVGDFYQTSSRNILGANARWGEEGHLWTQEDEQEYLIYNKLIVNMIRRRSRIIQNRWKKAYNIIRVISNFSKVLALFSIERDSHLKAFTAIGDEVTEGGPDLSKDPRKAFTIMDVSFKRKKVEPGTLHLSTRVQVLMCHPPDSRTKDEVTLILCDLQCYPSFCVYPLVVQNKIARYGMFMPIEERRVIIRQGHEPHNWYFVISGQAVETETVERDGQLVQNTSKFITQGMTFGEEAILNETCQPFTVTSRRPMQLIRLKKMDFYDVFKHSRLDPGQIPEHILYIKSMPFMVSFPSELLLKHPTMCYQHYCRPNVVLVSDSTKSEWIYVIRSGSCAVLMYIESTKASWRDLELALAHPQVNIDGRPLARIDTGPGKLPRCQKAYTLFQRMSAQQIEASNLDQVPVLHTIRGASKNTKHGLYLLGESKMKCPWPLDFFDAMNRTAYPVTLPTDRFPIHAQKPVKVLPPKGKNARLDVECVASICSNSNALTSAEEEHSAERAWGLKKSYTIDEIAHNKVFLTLVDGQLEERKIQQSSSSPKNPPVEDNKNSNKKIVPIREDDNEDDDDEQGKQKRGKKTSLESSKAADSSSNIDIKEAPSRKTNKKKPPSVTDRRKQYVIPEKCRPPPPARTWKKTCSSYACKSPPVYVEIEVLTEGAWFGLDQLKEPGWESRDQSGKVALISNGAEVVMLHKRFFMSFADDKTHVAIRDNMQIYPSVEAVQTRYNLQLAWQLYSQKVKDEFYAELRNKGRTKNGTYFQSSSIEIGDPYAAMKEF